MHIFLLTPINCDQPEWALSPVCSPVQVMAEDAAQARHAAAEQLASLDNLGSDESRLHNPWLRVDRVRTEQVAVADERLPLLAGYMPQGKRGRPSGTSLFVLTPVDLGPRQGGEQEARLHLAAVGGDALDHRIGVKAALDQRGKRRRHQ